MSVQKITPFLWFDSEAEAAARLYTSIFKRSKILSISRYPKSTEGVTGKPAGSVMTVEFQIDGQRFTALNGGPLFKFNESVSFVVHCDTQKEIDYFWGKLIADGGAASQCGWLKDKFGVSWQIVPSILSKLVSPKDPEKSNRVMGALLQMAKLDIAGLQAAAKKPAPAKPAKKKR